MKIIKNGFIFISLISILLACSDNIPLKRSDLDKYPWLVPFLVGNNATEIKGSHNIDLGTLEFSYELPVNALLKIDSIAKAENWETIKKEELKREYSKLISEELKDGGHVLMKIEIDSKQNRILFDIGNQ